MNKIDLTSKVKARNYLKSLAAGMTIDIVSPGLTTAAEDAIGVLLDGESTRSWANNRRKWNWTVAEVLAEFNTVECVD